MGIRVIYVHDEHQEIWDKAIELADEVNVSALLTSTLEQLIKNLEFVNTYGKFENVVLQYGQWGEERFISFQGYEIARKLCGNQIAYLTSKGKILIFVDSEEDLSTYYVYHSLAEAAGVKDKYGEPLFNKELLYDMSETLDIEYIEELDV